MPCGFRVTARLIPRVLPGVLCQPCSSEDAGSIDVLIIFFHVFFVVYFHAVIGRKVGTSLMGLVSVKFRKGLIGR